MTKDEIVKQVIVKQAQALFQQYGLKKTTMDEIAIACGKAKSTLYYYFKNKEDVFEAVIAMEIDHLRRQINEKLDAVDSLKEKLSAYFITFHKEVSLKANLYRILKGELLNDPLSSGQARSMRLKRFKLFLTNEKTYLTHVLEEGHDKGEFSKVDRANLSWFAETIIASFFGIMGYTVADDLHKNHEKMELTVNFFLKQIFN